MQPNVTSKVEDLHLPVFVTDGIIIIIIIENEMKKESHPLPA